MHCYESDYHNSVKEKIITNIHNFFTTELRELTIKAVDFNYSNLINKNCPSVSNAHDHLTRKCEYYNLILNYYR